MTTKTSDVTHTKRQVRIWNIGVKFGAVIRMPAASNQANEQFCLFLDCVLQVLIKSSTIINEHGVYAAPPKPQMTHLEKKFYFKQEYNFLPLFTAVRFWEGGGP